MTSGNVDVAIYAPHAGPLYRSPPEGSGGAEIQSLFIASTLAQLGFRVRHLVIDSDVVGRHGSVDVVALPSEFSHGGVARRRAVIAALRAADARVYIQRSAGADAALLGAFARFRGRRFVYSSSSDGDFLRDRVSLARAGASLEEWPTRMQHRLGLRLAHAIVVQTKAQRILASRRGLRAEVIPSFVAPAEAAGGPRDAFLWIGGLSEVKNPLAYLSLAEAIPEARFIMVVSRRGAQWEALERVVQERAARLPNIELLPAMTREGVLELYGRAVAVVNTSWFEGFPNTLLEGWARGAPALSLSVDPDGVITRRSLGAACGGDFPSFVTAAARLWETRASRPPATIEYVAETHAPEVVGPRWARLLHELL
jgi:glycosyltransferase involved in cell wall biosynthesis